MKQNICVITTVVFRPHEDKVSILKCYISIADATVPYILGFTHIVTFLICNHPQTSCAKYVP